MNQETQKLLDNKRSLIKKIIIKSCILVVSIVGIVIYFTNFFHQGESGIIAGMFFIGPILLCIVPIILLIIFVRLVFNIIDYISISVKINKAIKEEKLERQEKE